MENRPTRPVKTQIKNQTSTIVIHQLVRRSFSEVGSNPMNPPPLTPSPPLPFLFMLPLPLALLLPLFFIITSCADKPVEAPTPPPKKEETRLVGRIASIHKGPNFALIQSYGNWSIQTGVILATIGPEGRAANLKVTGEKIGQFAAADIQSGTLEIGDSVYTTLSFQAIDPVEVPEETVEPQNTEN
jgi:hypothetical protein